MGISDTMWLDILKEEEQAQDALVRHLDETSFKDWASGKFHLGKFVAWHTIHGNTDYAVNRQAFEAGVRATIKHIDQVTAKLETRQTMVPLADVVKLVTEMKALIDKLEIK